MAHQMMEDQKKRTVEVDRTQLIEKLKSNREKHVADYAEAIEGYRVMATEKLRDAHEKAKVRLDKNVEAGLKQLSEFDTNNPRASGDYLTLVEQITVELKVPRKFVAEYEAAIDMFTWDVRPTIELTTAEFQCFVRDVWDWSSDFAVTNSIYSNRKPK